MMDSSQVLHDALLRLTEASVLADSKVIEASVGEIASLVSADPQTIKDFFAADPEGIKLYLSKGIKPTSFAGKRFAAQLPQILEMVSQIYSHEKEQVIQFLEGKEDASKLATASLFMSPTIKLAILDEWVNKPWKGHSLSSKIWDFSIQSEDALLKMVASGIAEGKSPKQLQPIVRKVFKEQSTANIRRLLLTESSRVWSDVQNMAYQEFKHIKFVKLVYGVRHKKDCACTPWHKKGLIPFEEAPILPLHPSSSSFLQAVIE